MNSSTQAPSASSSVAPAPPAIPPLGLGTYKVSPDDAERVVSEALELGYRHVDTATMYGNEEGVGRALAASGLAREDLFVTTKLDNTETTPASVRPAFEASLERLGLDLVDLYLVHWPMARSTDLAGRWAAVVELLGTGRVTRVGVSNYTADHLLTIVDATGVTPAVNQVEVHPYLAQDALRAVHRRLGIITEAWSPLARGRVLVDPAVVATARRLGATPAQVVLAWHLGRGDVVCPKSTSRTRMAENLAARDLLLDDAARAALDALDRGERVGSSPERVEADGGRTRIPQGTE